MQVRFRKTGSRRYAVVLEVPNEPAQIMDPAPGFDEAIPHDLVHYLVEVELAMEYGVFGRAARGGGTFLVIDDSAGTARERARARRKKLRREGSLRIVDEKGARDMARSERLAGISDVYFRRSMGARPEPSRVRPELELSSEDQESVRRVVARLGQIASLWQRLPLGGELVFEWPNGSPLVPAVNEG